MTLLGVPPMWNGVVDVQDVAEAHLRAAFKPEAQGRYIICSESLSLLEMGQILRAHFGNKFPSRAISYQRRPLNCLGHWQALALSLWN